MPKSKPSKKSSISDMMALEIKLSKNKSEMIKKKAEFNITDYAVVFYEVIKNMITSLKIIRERKKLLMHLNSELFFTVEPVKLSKATCLN
jgi:hypothetical protein